jgi:hypothetical protein
MKKTIQIQSGNNSVTVSHEETDSLFGVIANAKKADKSISNEKLEVISNGLSWSVYLPKGETHG